MKVPPAWLVAQYEAGRSPADIARELRTYPNAVRRRLAELGVVLRTRGEAQHALMRAGSRRHPTYGRGRTDAEKAAIGAGRAAAWDEAARAVQAERCRQTLGKRTETQRRKARREAAATAHRGSKLELALLDGLARSGFACAHRDGPGDVQVAGRKATIFVEGPVWGSGADRRLAARAEAHAAAAAAGWAVAVVANRRRPTTTNVNGLLTKLSQWLQSGCQEVLNLEL